MWLACFFSILLATIVLSQIVLLLLYNSRFIQVSENQGCIFRLTCSNPELTEDHVLTSAYVKIFRVVTRNAVNKSV